MKYVEKNRLILDAYKFTGEVTEELKVLGLMAPNAFQINEICPQCGYSLKNHALIGVGSNFKIICPNSYIILGNNEIQVMSAENFESIYRPLFKDIEDAKYINIPEKI